MPTNLPFNVHNENDEITRARTTLYAFLTLPETNESEYIINDYNQIEYNNTNEYIQTEYTPNNQLNYNEYQNNSNINDNAIYMHYRIPINGDISRNLRDLLIVATSNRMRDFVQESFDQQDELIRNQDSIINLEILDKATIKETDECLNESCIICCSEFNVDETVVNLTCKHMFHEKCIKEWCHYKSTCPLCNEKIPIKD